MDFIRTCINYDFGTFVLIYAQHLLQHLFEIQSSLNLVENYDAAIWSIYKRFVWMDRITTIVNIIVTTFYSKDGQIIEFAQVLFSSLKYQEQLNSCSVYPKSIRCPNIMTSNGLHWTRSNQGGTLAHHHLMWRILLTWEWNGVSQCCTTLHEFGTFSS